MTELSTLERKRLSDLHQIASQLGIEQYRKYRKPELAQMIYKVATEQAAEQAAGRDDGPVQAAPEEPTSNWGAGVTPGETLKGVEYFRGGVRTNTVVMSTEPRVVRFMDTIHALEPEAGLQGFQI